MDAIILDLIDKVKNGFSDWKTLGNIRSVEHADGRVLLNYTSGAQWNEYENVCRGLVLHRDGYIVARPFDKFFNWGERGRYGTGHIVDITEKMDGSLGIGYWWDGAFVIHTRGSFDNIQGQWAQQKLAEYAIQSLSPEYTYCFEIVGPDSHIVIDYPTDEHGLYLLAIRNTQSGEYLPFFPDVYETAVACGFKMPPTYRYNNVSDLLARCGTLDSKHEGWVVYFSDGSRWKFKGDAYVELHRALSLVTKRAVVDAMLNDTFYDVLAGVPESQYGILFAYRHEILTEFADVVFDIFTMFSAAPKTTRKDFALFVADNCKHLSKYMFAMLDGKPISKDVLRSLR